jgi:endonuclease V-like protein UPF0215 family
MENRRDTMAVKNKDIAMKLQNQGYEILNVKISRDDSSKLVWIFEKTDSFKKAFDDIMKSLPKASERLTLIEKKLIVEMLTYKVSEYKAMGIKSDSIQRIIDKLS